MSTTVEDLPNAKGHDHIPRPSELEERAIRYEYDKITVPGNSAARNGKHHLNPPDSEAMRLCKGAVEKKTTSYTDKPIAAFPGDHLDLCLVCVFRWRLGP